MSHKTAEQQKTVRELMAITEELLKADGLVYGSVGRTMWGNPRTNYSDGFVYVRRRGARSACGGTKMTSQPFFANGSAQAAAEVRRKRPLTVVRSP